MNETFEEVNGLWRFLGRPLLVSFGGQKDISRTSSTCPYRPPPHPSTRASDTLPDDFYVKNPRLTSYDGIRRGSQPNDMTHSALAEVKACDLLMWYPHPDVTTYIGRQVSDRMERFQHTFMQEFSPRGFSNRMSRSARRRGWICLDSWMRSKRNFSWSLRC